MSEPTSPDDLAVGPPEHLHPFFLLTGVLPARVVPVMPKQSMRGWAQ